LANSLKWGSITLAAIAGLLLGFALTTAAYRFRLIQVPGHHHFIEHLDREVKLTPEQLHQIETMMRDSRAKMDQLHTDFHRQRLQIIYQTHDQIRALLTPEQQQRFDRAFAHPGERERRDRDD
jgi:Spy/CpxP family protein refolding chaperone